MKDNSSAGSDSPQLTNIVESKNMFKPLTTNQTPVFQPLTNNSVVFKGIGSVLDQNNRYVFPILRAEQTTMSAYSIMTSEESPPISAISGE